jgi:4-nitrophenol 2-monooxygenase / 4-nitrocatechol 4-monooxygenase, reductase component
MSGRSCSARPGHATIDGEVFRDVIGRFASGVTVVMARCDGANYGMTASAVSSLSLDPPLLLICVNRSNSTHKAISKSGAFAVNILDEAQTEVAATFATHGPSKFDGIGYGEGTLDLPVLPDALAVLECTLADKLVGGTHEVFVGQVRYARARDGAPLTYFRGRLGELVSTATPGAA